MPPFIVNQTGSISVTPRIVGGVQEPWMLSSSLNGIRVNPTGALYTIISDGANNTASINGNAISITGSVNVDDAEALSIWDNFKYQVGVDNGWWAATSGTSVITISNYFDGFSREQFPYKIYEASTNTYYTINGWTGSNALNSGNRIDLSTSISATTPKFIIKYNYSENAYDSTIDTEKVVVQNPVFSQWSEEVVVDTTNILTQSYYPSTNGYEMGNYLYLSLSGKMIDADGQITQSIQVTNDDDTTAANRDWITVYASRNDTNTVINNIAFTASDATGGTVTYALSYDLFNYKYFRIYYTGSGAGTAPSGSNTVICYMRRRA